MHRLLTAALTCIVAAALAVGAGLGIVAALHATPEQPNVPLVRFRTSTPPPVSTSPSPSDASSAPAAGRGEPDHGDAADRGDVADRGDAP